MAVMSEALFCITMRDIRVLREESYYEEDSAAENLLFDLIRTMSILFEDENDEELAYYVLEQDCGRALVENSDFLELHILDRKMYNTLVEKMNK